MHIKHCEGTEVTRGAWGRDLTGVAANHPFVIVYHGISCYRLDTTDGSLTLIGDDNAAFTGTIAADQPIFVYSINLESEFKYVNWESTQTSNESRAIPVSSATEAAVSNSGARVALGRAASQPSSFRDVVLFNLGTWELEGTVTIEDNGSLLWLSDEELLVTRATSRKYRPIRRVEGVWTASAIEEIPRNRGTRIKCALGSDLVTQASERVYVGKRLAVSGCSGMNVVALDDEHLLVACDTRFAIYSKGALISGFAPVEPATILHARTTADGGWTVTFTTTNVLREVSVDPKFAWGSEKVVAQMPWDEGFLRPMSE